MWLVHRYCHLCFTMAVARNTVALGSACLARQVSQHAGCAGKTEIFNHAAGMMSIDELRQLPESFLQLTSQRRRPQNITLTALAQGAIEGTELFSTVELNNSTWVTNFTPLGAVLNTLELNNSAWVTNLTQLGASEKRVEHGRRLAQVPHLLSHRVARGVSATGELIQTGRIAASINFTETEAEIRSGEPHEVPNVHTETLWQKLSVWPVLSLVQSHGGNDGLAEGILIFILVNVFCCAVTSGMCFIYSARKGTVYEGQQDESEDEEPPIRVPQHHRQMQETNVAASTRQQKPVSAGSWSPSFPGGSHLSESHLNPRQSEPPMSVRRHLCPELVVPRGSECVLAVRTLVSARLQQVEFEILDVNGKPVLQVEVSPQFASHSRPWPTQLQRSPTIALKSLNPRESTGAFVLCYCCNVTKEEESSGSKRNVYIYKDDDELFAHLMKDEARKRYVLTSGRLGLQLLFEGNFEEHAVDVTNEARELLAATEPGVMDFDPINKYYKLRVAADVDVGLVLCGLLAIDQMEVQ